MMQDIMGSAGGGVHGVEGVQGRGQGQGRASGLEARQVSCKPQTPNPKPQTPNPQPQALTPNAVQDHAGRYLAPGRTAHMEGQPAVERRDLQG